MTTIVPGRHLCGSAPGRRGLHAGSALPANRQIPARAFLVAFARGLLSWNGQSDAVAGFSYRLFGVCSAGMIRALVICRDAGKVGAWFHVERQSIRPLCLAGWRNGQGTGHLVPGRLSACLVLIGHEYQLSFG
jgi:hypothetical protein